jgi:hypothetical protein
MNPEVSKTFRYRKSVTGVTYSVLNEATVEGARLQQPVQIVRSPRFLANAIFTWMCSPISGHVWFVRYTSKWITSECAVTRERSVQLGANPPWRHCCPFASVASAGAWLGRNPLEIATGASFQENRGGVRRGLAISWMPLSLPSARAFGAVQPARAAREGV